MNIAFFRKYHKSLPQSEQLNLADTKYETNCQKFIKIYQNLALQGALDQEEIFNTARTMLADQKEREKATAGSVDGAIAQNFADKMDMSNPTEDKKFDVQQLFKD